MRQRRWLELIKDYNLNIQYHPGKANVVADALSHKSYYNNLMVQEEQPKLHAELEKLKLEKWRRAAKGDDSEVQLGRSNSASSEGMSRN